MAIIYTELLFEAAGNDGESEGDEGYDENAEAALASDHLQGVNRMFFHKKLLVGVEESIED